MGTGQQQGIDQLWIGANSSLYYLMIAAFAPLAGKLIRHYGINSVMVAGLLITAASACVLPGVHELGALFGVRALMGLGVCFYMVGGQTGLNIYADNERRGVIVAAHGAAFGVGFIVSPLIGTLLYAHFGTAAFLSGRDEDPEQRRLYEQALARAEQQMEQIAARVGDDQAVHDLLQRVSVRVSTYAGLVEAARVLPDALIP